MAEKQASGSKAAVSSAAGAATSIASETKLAFKTADGKRIPVIALLSKVWLNSNVGVYIDVPITGTPQARLLIGRYGVYAVEKAVQKMYHSADFGVFNPRMGKDGVDCVEAEHNVAADGAPTNVRISFTAKPHKAAQVLASLLARTQFAPPSADLSSPLLSDFPKDIGVLHAAAQRFYEALNAHAMVALIGGKKTSIKAASAEKFEAKYAKQYRKPELEKPGQLGSVELMPQMYAFGLELPKGVAAAAVAVASVLSRHGTVWQDGNTVSLTADPDYSRYARRVSLAALGNMHRISGIIEYYSRASAKDPASGNKVSVALAIAGIASGLPIASMIELLSVKSVDVSAIAGAVGHSAAALKAEKAAGKAAEKAEGKKAEEPAPSQ